MTIFSRKNISKSSPDIYKVHISKISFMYNAKIDFVDFCSFRLKQLLQSTWVSMLARRGQWLQTETHTAKA